MSKQKIIILILLAMIFRLYHVDYPVSGWHSWRQSDTAAIARNFSENHFNLFYPQIDWGGNSPGYVESEFQVYPFIVSILYSLFGYGEIWGRALSVLFSLITLYGLYLLIKKIVDERTALWSVFIYSILPLNIYYSRAFMPESAMLMCLVLGIYFFSEWLDNERHISLILTWFFISIAILLKIPCLYIGLPLAFLAWTKYNKNVFRVFQIWLLIFFILLPVFLWYYHAHKIFLSSNLTFNIWGFGTDKWGNLDLISSLGFYNSIFLKSISERHLTYIGFLFFIIGLFVKRKTKNEYLFDWWLISVIIYFLIVAKGNMVHEYYQLPFMLPAVVYIGKVFVKVLSLNNLKSGSIRSILTFSFFSFCLFSILILSFLRYYDYIKSENSDNLSLQKLSNAVSEMSNKGELFITVSNGNPDILYRCNRKGWIISCDELNTIFLNSTKYYGAKYIIGEKKYFADDIQREKLQEISRKFSLIRDERDYFIIKLNQF